MTKIFVLGAVVAALAVGCAPVDETEAAQGAQAETVCGGAGGPCCWYGSDGVCAAGYRCVGAGFAGATGPTAIATFAQGRCVACGRLGQVCCTGGTRSNLYGGCDPGLTCASQVCEPVRYY